MPESHPLENVKTVNKTAGLKLVIRYDEKALATQLFRVWQYKLAYTCSMKTLTSLATISITGSDAKTFLQGQLSNDMDLLNAQRTLLASCNSAQGRVQAILTLIEHHDAIIAVLPASIIESMILRLRKYILRSKVVIKDSRDSLQCFASTREELHAARLPVPALRGEHAQHNGVSVMRWWDQVERYLVLQAPTESNNNADDQWLLADIRAGLPQVFQSTHEAFVAQMLNLDVLDGISFNKGCYTGQEIIARTHYRGAIKRRMFRLSANCKPPAEATRILGKDDASHAGDVVMSAHTDDGCEMLAVLNLNQQDTVLRLETDRTASLQLLPLPYELPSAD